MANALGLLETKGMVALVCGTDAMLKAANVELLGPAKSVGSALMSVVVTGDVAAVKAALDAGSQAASEMGEVVSAHVIARPHNELGASLSAKPKAAAKK